MTNIVLTNDDGPVSKGLLSLAKELASKCNLTVVVPDGQRSATGKALTFNRPLRMNDFGEGEDYRLVTHDGTPADSVILAKGLVEEIDLFVSGINMGGNIGYQSMATSGTVGAVIEAAIQGYPGIAASRVVNSEEWFNHTGNNRSYEQEARITVDLVTQILEEGMPVGIDALNLNFPSEISSGSYMVVTKPTRIRISNELERRTDPNGSPYYWIAGRENEPETGTDAYEVLKRMNISLSPIIIDAVDEPILEVLRDFIRP